MSGYKIKDDAQRWREALEPMGVDFVRQTLREHPGRSPEDPFHDLVPEPPYPTRQFVQDWVLEQENRFFRLSRPTIYIMVALVVVLLMFWFASDSFQSALPPPAYNPAPQVNAQQSP